MQKVSWEDRRENSGKVYDFTVGRMHACVYGLRSPMYPGIAEMNKRAEKSDDSKPWAGSRWLPDNHVVYADYEEEYD